MATNAAMPNIMDETNRNNRDLFLRLSRQAISKSQGRVSGRLSAVNCSGIGICFFVSYQFAAFNTDDALGFSRQFQVVCYYHQCSARFPVQIK